MPGQPTRGRLLTGLEMFVLESTLYLGRQWNQCGIGQVGESLESGGSGFKFWLKTVGEGEGRPWTQIQPGFPLEQESGSEGVRPGERPSQLPGVACGVIMSPRDLDRGGAKLGSRVVGRPRPAE